MVYLRKVICDKTSSHGVFLQKVLFRLRLRSVSEEEDARDKKAEIAFDYGTIEQKSNGEAAAEVASDDSDSEAEPFVPPPGIKLPMGLAVVRFELELRVFGDNLLFSAGQSEAKSYYRTHGCIRCDQGTSDGNSDQG